MQLTQLITYFWLLVLLDTSAVAADDSSRICQTVGSSTSCATLTGSITASPLQTISNAASLTDVVSGNNGGGAGTGPRTGAGTGAGGRATASASGTNVPSKKRIQSENFFLARLTMILCSNIRGCKIKRQQRVEFAHRDNSSFDCTSKYCISFAGSSPFVC